MVPADRAGKPGRLGRGLSALLGEDESPDRPEPAVAAAPAEKGSSRNVPIEDLAPSPYQPRHRFDTDELDELAGSIRELGILQPILVRPSRDGHTEYEIIAGERRWRAAQLAQLHQVPVIEKDLDDSEVLEIALVENLQRENLSPLDEAEGYRRLIDEFDHTQEDLARVLGKSRSHVANMVRLLLLPDPVKQYLNDGKLTAGHARALLSAADPAAAAKRVVSRGLNVRQTEKLVQDEGKEKGVKAKPPKPKPPAKDVDTVALERDLSNLLGLKVDITFEGHGGTLTVHYDSVEQLDDILHRLSDGAHGRVPVSAAEDEEPLPEEVLPVDDVDAAIQQLEEGAALDDGAPAPDVDVTNDGEFALSDDDLQDLLSEK